MLATTNIDLGYQWAPILFGLVVGLVISWLFAEKRRQSRDRAGVFANAQIPELGAAFDVSQRYDIVCVTEGLRPVLLDHLKDVAILGYVGERRGEPTWRTHIHQRWLVVAFRDGRRAYVLPRSVKMLVQSAAQA